MTITVIGGGMAGATLALVFSQLSRGTMQINLVETQAPETYNHPKFNSHAIALTQGSCRELISVGIWPVLASLVTKIARIEVSDKGHIGKLQIVASDYQLPALGYVIELHDISKQLFRQLLEAPGVRLHCPASLISIKRRLTENIITLDNGDEFNTQLVVAADGSWSTLAAQCGIRWWQRDYQQVAISANISTEIPHGGTAFERFTAHGTLALLPISDKYSSLIWCIPSEWQTEIIGWDDWRFCYELQQVFGWQLGRIIDISTRKYYPLFLRIAERHISHRLALVGNAAQTLHLIAGQGFNLGLRDVITLAETLVYAASRGEDVGDYAVLLRYRHRRLRDQAIAVKITDSLIHLFVNCYLPLVIGRNLGLFAMAYIPSLRDALVRQTLGWMDR